MILVQRIFKAIGHRERKLGTDSAHGRARMATRGELSQAGLLGKARDQQAIYLGALVELVEKAPARPRVTSQQVIYGEGVHLLTVGPTSAGKGAGLIIPNLTRVKRSIVVVDPKGEAATVTANRRRDLGEVFVFGAVRG